MSTYTKLPVCAVNYALGYQTVEKARANFDAHFDAWALRHGVIEPAIGWQPRRNPRSPPPPRSSRGWEVAGHHNDLRIPRDVVQVTQVAATLTAPALVRVSSSWFVTAGERLGQGTYRFTIAELSTYWALAVPSAPDASSTKLAICRSDYPTTPGAPRAVYVTCYEISGGFATADMSFTLTIYGSTS